MASTAPGLESGLKILEMIADSKGLGFNQLKIELGLSPASLNRYLKTLIERRFIEKNENQQYIIGKRIVEITRGLGDSDMIAATVQPVLENISASLGSTSMFICFKQGRMICTGKYVVQEGLTMQDVGENRTDYILHPWGFLLLASLEHKTRQLFIENANVYERFKAFIPDSELLNSFILEAGEYGYSDDKEMVLQNIRRIAVPVYSGNSGDKLVGAIGIGMLGGMLNDAGKENVVKILKQKAESLRGIL